MFKGKVHKTKYEKGSLYSGEGICGAGKYVYKQKTTLYNISVTCKRCLQCLKAHRRTKLEKALINRRYHLNYVKKHPGFVQQLQKNYRAQIRKRCQTDETFRVELLRKAAKHLNALRKRDPEYYKRCQIASTEWNERMRAKCGNPAPREWTLKEMKYLKQNYRHKFGYEMAMELGRSLQSIEHKLCKLKLLYNHRWSKGRIV